MLAEASECVEFEYRGETNATNLAPIFRKCRAGLLNHFREMTRHPSGSILIKRQRECSYFSEKKRGARGVLDLK